MAPKKGAVKAEAASTSTSRPSKKSAATPVAPKPKLTARKAGTPKAQKKDATAKSAKSAKSASATKATPAPSDRHTLTPSSVKKASKKAATANASGMTSSTKKPQKNAATANAAGAAAPEPKVGPRGRSTMPDEIPPEAPKAQKKDATAKTASTSATKATPANISRKRRSSSIEEEAPVATATATKKIRMDPGSSKRKATADANKRARKVRKMDEQEDEDDQEDDAVQPVKLRRKAAAKKAAAPAKKPATSKVRKAKKEPAVKLQAGVQINFAPTQPLDIFVFGSGESGELGLSNKTVDGKKPVNVKRPRIHPLLPAENVGVVQIACGGMHSVALTKNNKILTWGVNDQGALGRDTTWDGGLRDADAEDNEDNDRGFESLNPIECTPTEVDTKNIANGTKFAKVIASDSASFALTEDGRIYGWGTFRVSFLQVPVLTRN